MNTSVSAMPFRRVCAAYLAEAKSECLRNLRNPAFLPPVLLFPTMFYVFFGVLLVPAEAAGASRQALAGLTTFGVMSPGMFGFGVSLAIERDGGLLTLRRALPMPPAAYLLGKMVMAMAASAVVVVLMLAIALTLGRVPLTLAQMVELLATGVFGVLPFCALGMWLGTLFKGQAAPGVINIVFLPMAFVSGLWVPLRLLPDALQTLAPVWPAYHLNAFALASVGLGEDAVLAHVVVLAGYTLLFTGLAARRLRRCG